MHNARRWPRWAARWAAKRWVERRSWASWGRNSRGNPQLLEASKDLMIDELEMIGNDHDWKLVWISVDALKMLFFPCWTCFFFRLFYVSLMVLKNAIEMGVTSCNIKNNGQTLRILWFSWLLRLHVALADYNVHFHGWKLRLYMVFLRMHWNMFGASVMNLM